jgi:hypothetical protein
VTAAPVALAERPLWTILVPTIGAREHLFRRLLDVLLPQLDAHGGAVQVLAWRNAGERPLGDLRDDLLASTPAEYVSFVDDDDLVSEDYVEQIARVLGGPVPPDHVGFKLEYHENGTMREVVDHSLRHRRWHRNADGHLVRDFTHVDPIRRDLALRGRFGIVRPGRAEDRAWVKQVRPHLRTEAYVDRILYRYLWSQSTSSWQRPERVAPPMTPLPVVESPHFAWHRESV